MHRNYLYPAVAAAPLAPAAPGAAGAPRGPPPGVPGAPRCMFIIASRPVLLLTAALCSIANPAWNACRQHAGHCCAVARCKYFLVLCFAVAQCKNGDQCCAVAWCKLSSAGLVLHWST